MKGRKGSEVCSGTVKQKDGVCLTGKKKNQAMALAACAKLGARLCSASELVRGYAENTGYATLFERCGRFTAAPTGRPEGSGRRSGPRACTPRPV